MTSTTVIVTADDYGLCDEINQAIEEALAAGVLQTTCVMMNMPHHIALSRLKLSFPRTSIGLHWTLSQGKPVSRPEQVPTLVDKSGNFLPVRDFKRLWRLGRIEESDLRSELKAQYDCFYRLAGHPSYWNTHEGAHLAPGLFLTVTRIALELGVNRMRCHRRIVILRRGTLFGFFVQNPVFWLKGIVITAYSARAERMGARMPSGLIHAPGYDKAAEIGAILTVPPLKKEGRVVELTLHPARSVVSDLFGALTESRLREYQALIDRHLCKQLKTAGIKLAGFDAIRA